MSVDYFQQELLICFSTNNPLIQNAAQTANQYTELMKTGQVNRDEYMELMADIQRSVNIDQNMSILETKQRLNTAINGLINLASLL